MRRLTVLACLVAGSLLATPALAQEAAAGDQVVVTLTSGATFHGTLVGQDERTLTLRSAAGTVRSLPLASVGRVEKAGSVPVAAPAAPMTAEAAPAAKAAPPAVGDQVVVTLVSGGFVRGKLVAQDPWHIAVLIPDGPVRELVPREFSSLRHDSGLPEQAAPAAPRPPTHIGLGVALPAASDFPSFYLPIQVSAGFRVEPEIGVVRLDVGGESATALQLGLGLLGTRSVAPQVGAYGGVRLQLQRLDASGTDGITNVRVAGVLGGEWQPVPQVALGVEAQLAYVSLDRAITSTSSSASGLTTAGLLFFRVFLN